MAVRFGCPIYTYENILEQAGVQMEGEAGKTTTSKVTESSTSDKDNLKNMSLKDLQSLLEEVLENEDYIKAIAIRDELKSREA
jgi:protein-arginine kinase activator protein McsA